jgi:hypothetical protein
MSDASNKDDETTTPSGDDKGVIHHPNSMNPHIVPEKDEDEQTSEK